MKGAMVPLPTAGMASFTLYAIAATKRERLHSILQDSSHAVSGATTH